jgi:hypothetical protein
MTTASDLVILEGRFTHEVEEPFYGFHKTAGHHSVQAQNDILE